MKYIYYLHPFLFAIYPILFLYNHNRGLIYPGVLFWPIVIGLVAAGIIYLPLCRIVKNTPKAAAITSLFIFGFFSFQHLFEKLMATSTFLRDVYTPLFYCCLSLLLFLFVFITALILKTKNDLKTLTKFLNLFISILVLMPLAGIIYYHAITPDILTVFRNAPWENQTTAVEKLPDIYYIILDGYARADTLEKKYDYDNSEFLTFLSNQGFYIATGSYANYPQTYLSMNASLNMGYLNELASAMGDSDDRLPLRKLLKNNRVYDVLKPLGYSFVGFPFTWTGTYNNQKVDLQLETKLQINEFYSLLLTTTPFSSWINEKVNSDLYRNKYRYTFEQIPQIATLKKPTFTYVHLILPHPPFVFGPNGEKLDPSNKAYGFDGDHYFEHNPDKDAYIKGYRNQLEYLNSQIKTVVEKIMENSDQKPIIVLQSDHGPGLDTYWEEPEKTDIKERLAILNAYYLGDYPRERLYPAITPANSFRVIFNTVLGTSYELLPDKNYFATWSRPYRFIDVTEDLKAPNID